jgi:predicted HAD superfamily Cof-like phosphohydrolase
VTGIVEVSPGADLPTLDVQDQVKELRCALIEEEAAEFRAAVEDGDIVAVADAIADLLYVVYGAALTFGIPAHAVFTEVHRSNMTKLDDDGLPRYRTGRCSRAELLTTRPAPDLDRRRVRARRYCLGAGDSQALARFSRSKACAASGSVVSGGMANSASPLAL